MKNKKAYFQGGGKENEPTPGKPKYKKEPLDPNDTKSRGVLFRNYDLYDTGGPGPGAGLYSRMDKYKSVGDFRKKKQEEKASKKKDNMVKALWATDQRKANLVKIEILIDKYAELIGDNNNLVDPTENTLEEIPYSPSDIAPLGLLDGIYPKEDLDDKPVTNLYYGRIETHYAKDKK